MKHTKSKLIKLLQKAHAGERGAALAYHGHWKSLTKQSEVTIIQNIETDERRHRARIAEIMVELNAKPLFFREILFLIIGQSVALICQICGRFCSTYFAGMVENGNVHEYQRGFEYANSLGLKDLANDFLEMKATEAQHEIILQQMICEHPFLPFFAFLFRWGNDQKFN